MPSRYVYIGVDYLKGRKPLILLSYVCCIPKFTLFIPRGTLKSYGHVGKKVIIIYAYVSVSSS